MKKRFGMLMLVLGLALLGGCSGDGTVEINSSYEGAEIYIDGDLKGNMPSGSYGITLSEGKHEIELIKPISDPDKYDQYYAKKSITVADKSTQSIYVSLSRRQSPDYKAQWEEKQRKQMESVLASIQANMVTIPSGSFKMERNDGDSVHTFRVSSFKINKYELTQAQWQAVMGYNPSKFRGDKRPVDRVSWNDVQKFIKVLNSKTNKKYRLPTEVEWEYAARAGTSGKWSWGSNERLAGRHAWFYSNSDAKTHFVGMKDSNSWGLYDVHGNVSEWVQDARHDGFAPSNGSAWLPDSNSFNQYILCGGSWETGLESMRFKFTSSGVKSYGASVYGFRLAQDN